MLLAVREVEAQPLVGLAQVAALILPRLQAPAVAVAAAQALHFKVGITLLRQGLPVVDLVADLMRQAPRRWEQLAGLLSAILLAQYGLLAVR